MNLVSGDVLESNEGGTPIKQIPEELVGNLIEGYEKRDSAPGPARLGQP